MRKCEEVTGDQEAHGRVKEGGADRVVKQSGCQTLCEPHLGAILVQSQAVGCQAKSGRRD